jgi:EAL domain-containing protein (putative c-di-GMP-specific phosphodiesterase class I)
MLSPEIFIPLLEDTGLIVPVGDWVMNKACEQLRSWHDAGIAVPQVAVNIAPRQLLDPNFTHKVQQILTASRLEPGSLELEITESTLMENEQLAIKTLQELHDMGVSIAMDDFGTGYSSLRYLRAFPLRTLKIDRAFVSNLPYNQDDCNLASTIITMGHGMGLKVVAEGVETEAQFSFLKGLDCDLTQGYFFSRPIPYDQIGDFLATKL